jgi:hypothetical protein
MTNTYTHISKVIEYWKLVVYQNGHGNVVIPAKCLEDIAAGVKSQGGGRNAKEERDVRHRVRQRL